MTASWMAADAEVRHGRLWGWNGADRDRRALTFVDSRSFTVGELWNAVDVRQRELAAAGLRKGDRLCLMQGNGPDFVLDVLAAFRLGIVVAPLNTGLRGESLSATLQDLSPQVLRMDAEFEPAVRHVLPGLDGVVPWLVGGEPEGRLEPAAGASDWDGFDLSDIAVILLTSGTTGLPKGVLWPHQMALTVAEHTTWVMGYDARDTIYTCLPLFHINGLFCALYAGLLAGAEVVIARRFSASRYWAEVAEVGATVTNMMGSIPAVLWRREPDAVETAHRLRLGMVLPLPAAQADFEKRFGFPITETYGSTDSGLPLGIPFGAVRPAGSCGIPSPGWEAAVFDEHDRKLPDGVEGELVLRPGRPFIGQAGYWRRPQTTIESTRNLWFHTGDVVLRDEGGWYYYRGRGKDMIRVSGENVAPIQVEAALLRHPGVEEVAVFGLPAELGEESVAAAVVLRSGVEVDPLDLRQFVEPDLPYFAVPRFIAFVPELPKTETAKVIKSALQERGVTPGHWDGGQPRRAPLEDGSA
jgi:crotonobetaine/carnitine-CoA ligase